MLRSWRKLILAVPLLAALPLAAVPEPPAAAPPEQREAAWLRQEARAFLALPREQRERMIRLDEALHKVRGPARQQHLRDVLRRYADWLDRLPEAERRQILEAPNRQGRLRQIRALREAQWLGRQPRAVRTALAALARARAVELTTSQPTPGAGLSGAAVLLAPGPGGRPFLVARLRQEERRRRHQWHIAVRHWDDLGKRPLPTHLKDFKKAVQLYVREYLLPTLAPQERDLLQRAEGELWFPYVLVYLADRHPPALPGEYGPKTFKELPAEVQDRIRKAVMVKGGKGPGEPVLKKLVRAAEGKWPEFAVAVTRFTAQWPKGPKGPKGKGIRLSPFEFWPVYFGHLSPDVQRFLDEKLRPALSAEEDLRLTRSEGKWPDYPRTIQELATHHSLRVPWQTLPDARKQWDKYRNWSRRN